MSKCINKVAKRYIFFINRSFYSKYFLFIHFPETVKKDSTHLLEIYFSYPQNSVGYVYLENQIRILFLEHLYLFYKIKRMVVISNKYRVKQLFLLFGTFIFIVWQ